MCMGDASGSVPLSSLDYIRAHFKDLRILTLLLRLLTQKS